MEKRDSKRNFQFSLKNIPVLKESKICGAQTFPSISHFVRGDNSQN